ncbi:ricin-type beta-trefoil lectin domain protein [Micromonospora sp. NPDC050417]|uniref:ricin-type beta-trefoil lectin domain protein n=1 Tax=Micromonospora sp. NPDC050417 TaxID=3364280 RepID=UPI00379F32C9
MRVTSGTGGLSKLRTLLLDMSSRAQRRSTLLRRVAQFLRSGLDRLDSPLRRAVAAGVLLVLSAATGVVAASGFGAATADDTARAGLPVPASQVQTIAAAALSCPVLTPPRLAGQLMTASGFNPAARTEGGGEGVAGLTESVWNAWKPAPAAKRSDPAANIAALARHMCDLSGQVRQAGVGGDQWRLTLAAYHSGLPAVRDAGRVPARADRYVSTVAGYAAWYARRPEFAPTGPSASPGPVGGAEPHPGTPAAPVPADYLAAVMAAGRTCPAVPAARIAAQLMASSAFNPNLFGRNGAQGIAQFNPTVWARYAPDAGTLSPWDPQQAIAALSVVMCTLVEEQSQAGQGDPYPAALAAFQWGPEAVQRAGGVPDAPEVRNFIALVQGYAATYEHDPRLGGTPLATTGPSGTPRSPSTPSGSASPGGPVSPGNGTGQPAAPPAAGQPVPGGQPAPGGQPGQPAPGGQPAPPPVPTPSRTNAAPPPPPPPPPAPPANPQPQPVGGAGPIIGNGSNRCIDVTDGAYQNNPQLQIWTCTGGPNQQWTIYNDGTVRAYGKCMTVAGGSTTNGAKIVLSTCSGSSSQLFTLNNAHDLVNKRADKCVDVVDKLTGSGTRLQLWDCAGTSNQKWHR